MNAVTGDNKPACAICGCTEKMNEELNIKELLAELEAYRWRDKKALILKKFRLIDPCVIVDDVDDLMLQGYTFDEIVRAIKEHIAEQLAELLAR